RVADIVGDRIRELQEQRLFTVGIQCNVQLPLPHCASPSGPEARTQPDQPPSQKWSSRNARALDKLRLRHATHVTELIRHPTNPSPNKIMEQHMRNISLTIRAAAACGA